MPGAREALGAAPGAPPRVAPGLEACASVRARAHPGFRLGWPTGCGGGGHTVLPHVRAHVCAFDIA